MKFLIATALSLTLYSSGALTQQDELLPPEQAFAFSANIAGPDVIEAIWTIADGYYMYRDKFSFMSGPDGPTIKPPFYPQGKLKQDALFGDVETYEGSVRITLPFQSLAGDPGQFFLTAKGQGCNEPVGVCYPPVTRTVALQLAASDPTALNSDSRPLNPVKNDGSNLTGSSESLSELQKLLGVGSEQAEFLDPENAFKLTVLITGENALAVRFRIAEGYYLYRDKLQFSTFSGPARIGPYDLPPGKSKLDAYFGEVSVYNEDFDVLLPLERTGTDSGEFSLITTYQGCAEKGICYPPIKTTHRLTLPAFITSAAAADSDNPDPKQSGKSLIGYLSAAFVAGFLLTFTPCVLPLIPIVSSLVVGQGRRGSRFHGGAISMAYVLGTAVTYTVIGAVAGATGEQLQAYFQNVWAIGFISLILVLMALSMFGVYEIRLPTAVQSRLSESTAGLSGGSFGMIFVLGVMSALVVGACVSPLLISVLSIAILKGSAYLGAALMFCMAAGMGIILVAIGFGAHAILPHKGPWMERVQHGLGILLIAVAIYLLGVIPEIPVLFLWAALLVVTGVYLGATQPLPKQASGWRYLWKGLGTFCLIWGVIAMLGGFSGRRDILRPIDLNLLGGSRTASNAVHDQAEENIFQRIATNGALDRHLAAARSAGRSVILDFYAEWCTDCIRMEKTTFSDPTVLNQLSRFELLQVDVTDAADPDSKAIKQRFGVYGPPAIVFFGPDGDERPGRLYGYRNPTEFLSFLSAL